MKYRFSIILGFILSFCFTPLGAQTEAQNQRFTVNDVPNIHLRDRLAYVSDPCGAVEQPYLDSLNRELKVLEDSTGVQCAVVVLPAINEDDAQDFAYNLFSTWGLGDEEKNNGLLILLLTAEGGREITFQTGYGIEEVLPDALCKRIQTLTMIPYLKEGNYGAGLLAGVRGVWEVMTESPGAKIFFTDTTEDTPLTSKEKETIGYIILAWCLLGVFLALLPVYRTKDKVAKGQLTPFEAFFSYKNNSTIIGCLSIVLFFPVLPIVLIILFINKSKFKHRALVCSACGQRMTLSPEVIVKSATTTSTGLKEQKATCPVCGHSEVHSVTSPKIPATTSSNHNSSSGGSSWGSGGFGGSWGGGHSGGGGASSRF